MGTLIVPVTPITEFDSYGFIVYYAFLHNVGYPMWLAAILGAFPVVYGTIRQARQQDRLT